MNHNVWRNRCKANKGSKRIVRRVDRRHTSDENSAHVSRISNIGEKDRANDVEQFDDILRMLRNNAIKSENRFGHISDDEKIFAIDLLMPESLLNYRFRGAKMTYDALITALVNMILVKGRVGTERQQQEGQHEQSDGYWHGNERGPCRQVRHKGGRRVETLRYRLRAKDKDPNSNKASGCHTKVKQ